MEQRFFQEYGSQGLVVIAIDPDDQDYTQIAEVASFASEVGVTFPIGVEETSNYELFNSNYTGANPYPVDVIVDKKGIIRYVAREYDPDHMAEVVEKLLAE